jgi:hypothetical protein
MSCPSDSPVYGSCHQCFFHHQNTVLGTGHWYLEISGQKTFGTKDGEVKGASWLGAKLVPTLKDANWKFEC